MSRYTYDVVKCGFEEVGYILLETVYSNCDKKLSFLCDKGHKGSMSWSSLKKGYRCRFCAPNRKKTSEEVREFIESCGYSLLGGVYENEKSVLTVRCPKGHIVNVAWNYFQQGTRCSDCSGAKTKTIADLVNLVSTFGYGVEDASKFSSGSSAVVLRCARNHLFSSSYTKFKCGRRCPYCSKKARKTREEVSSFFDSIGYKLVSFVSSSRPFFAECSKGHVFEYAAWSQVASKKRCPCCSKEKLMSLDKVHSSFLERGFVLLSTVYVNSSSKLDYICNMGHRASITWDSFKAGGGCNVCTGRRVIDETSLAFVRPDLLLDWAYDLNGISPKQIAPSSHKKIWWRCSTCGYVWETKPNYRVCSGSGCPKCAENSKVSKISQRWLDSLNIPAENREVWLEVEGKRLRVDGFDPKTNTVYEFLGDYWHGNPDKFNSEEMNWQAGVTFGELYKRTLDRFCIIARSGYSIIDIWESEYLTDRKGASHGNTRES